MIQFDLENKSFTSKFALMQSHQVEILLFTGGKSAYELNICEGFWGF